MHEYSLEKTVFFTYNENVGRDVSKTYLERK